MTNLPPDSRDGPERPVLLLLFTVYLAEVLRNAWLADDAFITLRTVDNFVHGLGLTYNVQERVQTYTHPLWMGLVALFYSLSREVYFTVLALSLACSAAAVSVLVFRLSATPLHGIFALVALLTSSAFVDFSTSGLENPLTHLLLGIFACLYARGARDARSLALLAATAGLGILNRMDTALLFLPGLLYAASKSRRVFGPLALGLAPFFAWEVFSLVYYGFPFPNTAYAKLGAGLPRAELIEQGWDYLIDSLYRDPVTLILTFTALLAVARRRTRADLALAAGIPLHLLYLVAVGGDFMSGRFLSAPYYLAIVLLAAAALPRRSILAMTAVAVALHLGPLTRGRVSSEPQVLTTSGIVDEKSFYFGRFGLPAVYRGARVRQTEPARPWEPGDVEVYVEGTIGFRGFARGPGYHVVDVLGLADPLLARLPTQDRFDWRIGHFSRKLPAGYLDTLRSGTNRIEDRNLARYYDLLSLVVRGELFGWPRARAIVALNLGRYDRLIDRDFYRRPYSVEIPAGDLAKAKSEGSRWDASTNLVLSPRIGALIRLAEVSHCSRLRLGLAGGARYRLAYYRGEAPVPYYERGDERATWQSLPVERRGGIRTWQVDVPADVSDHGYDALLIYPIEGARLSVGHVLTCPGPANAATRSGDAPGSS